VKVGDLVKFKSHTIDSGPLGIVLDDHYGGSFKIAWCCKYTATGHYQASILEVVDG
jgi:hypothetical protein